MQRRCKWIPSTSRALYRELTDTGRDVALPGEPGERALLPFCLFSPCSVAALAGENHSSHEGDHGTMAQPSGAYALTRYPVNIACTVQ